MPISRSNPVLNEAIEALDQRFMDAPEGPSQFRHAWESLRNDELEFIAGEIYHCKTDLLYYLANYHCINDEHGNVQTLWPLWHHQESLAELMDKLWKKQGWYKIIILKPRQIGGTTWAAAVTFHATLFTERAYTLVMAHEEDATAEIYRRVVGAMSQLPWWMRAETSSKQQERHIVFQRKDEKTRMIDPGLGSTLVISNSQKAAGIAIGRSIRCGHFSEVSRWPDPTIWTSDIEPSMNARDMKAFMESTAYGRTGLFWHMWRSAEQGKSDWTPFFVPVYRVKKYFTPIPKGQPFVLDPDEKALRDSVKASESFTIPNGFFNWRRRKRQSVINAEGRDDTLYESYPCTSGEAFINSGFCAFPKKCLNEQERNHCCPPKLIGEIRYTSAESPQDISGLHPPAEEDLIEKPERFNRLWVWETPDDNDAIEYYIGCDTSSGDGKDFTDIAVYRIGYGIEPHVQVAEFHGLINPSHTARVLAALGYWYHTAEIAVEYMGSGISCGDDLRNALDYSAIYRWRVADRLNSITQHIHWLTNVRTREDMINRMNECLLDGQIILRNKHLIEEMRDFGWEERDTRAEAMSGNDDMVAANCIAICALHQSGKRQAWAENSGFAGEGAKHAHLLPKCPSLFGVYNQVGQQVTQCDSEAAGWKFIDDIAKKHNIPNLRAQWRVVPLLVSKANTVYSVLWDQTGAEHELATIHGLTGQQIMQSPDTVSHYRKYLHMQAKYGDDLLELEDDE